MGLLRFFMDRILTNLPSNILGLNIRCSGDEKSLLDCDSDFDNLTGYTFTQCQHGPGSKAPAVICERGEIRPGSTRKGLAAITANYKVIPIYFQKWCMFSFHSLEQNCFLTLLLRWFWVSRSQVILQSAFLAIRTDFAFTSAARG